MFATKQLANYGQEYLLLNGRDALILHLHVRTSSRLLSSPHPPAFFFKMHGLDPDILRHHSNSPIYIYTVNKKRAFLFIAVGQLTVHLIFPSSHFKIKI
jgi:hypothetical protein